MAYTIRKFDGTELVVLQDGTIDTTTGVSLVGRNYTGYGELQNENFVYLLENFSNDAPPPRPIKGQIWFNSQNNTLFVYDGSQWNIIGNAIVSDTAPETASPGAIWFDSVSNKLYCWIGEWIFIGPESTPGFGETRSKSTTLLSESGERYPVIMMMVNGVVVAIVSSADFTIASVERPNNFIDLIIGLNLPNLSTKKNIKGNLDGTVLKADQLTNARLINGVAFNGTRDIAVNAPSPFFLNAGEYLIGSNFNGSVNTTWSVNATASNVIGTIVARNSAGDFTAREITANLIGDVRGNVTTEAGTSTFDTVVANRFIGATLTGNAFSANQLSNPRKINGIDFDGTKNISIPIEAEAVTGSRLANNVVNSSLQTLGTLTELFVAENGISIDNSLKLNVDSGVSKIVIDNDQGLYISVKTGSSYSSLEIINGAKNLAQGGTNVSAIVPKNSMDLGSSYQGFNRVYANRFVGEFEGTSSIASTAVLAENLKNGSAGSIPYQTSANTTSFVPPGTAGQVLRSAGTGQPVWGSISFSTLSRGNYLTGSNYDGIVNTTWSVDATSSNVGNKVVARDSTGNFSAGVITATLNGNITGNANTVTNVSRNQIVNALGCDPCSQQGGSSGVTLNTTQTITGQKTFTGGVISQAWNFNNNNSIFYATGPTRVQVGVNGNFPNQFYPTRFVVEGSADGLSGEKAPGGVVVGVDNGSSGGAGVAGIHNNNRPGIGVGVLASAQNSGFTGAVFQGVSARSKSSSFVGFRLYASSGGDAYFTVSGNGNVAFDGVVTGAADYAEYFEWIDGNPNNEDRVGMTVSLIDNKIKIAEEGEIILGVVSAVPAVAGDGHELEWQGKYVRDDFGRIVEETYFYYEWIDENNVIQTEPSYGNLSKVPENAQRKDTDEFGNTLTRPKYNPLYDPEVTYIPRSKRKEWAPIGLLGKLKILRGQITANNWIKLRNINNNIDEWLVK